jgi:hypothetical protein
LIFADQIFQKVGGIKNHFGPFFCTLFAHPFKFAGCKIFPRKTKDFTAHWVSKKMALPLTLIWANRHAGHDFKQKHIRKIARFNL